MITDMKALSIITGIIFGTFLITLLTFIYRYMWFSVETIPAGRWIAAVFGVMIFGGIFFAAVEEAIEEARKKKNNAKKDIY